MTELRLRVREKRLGGVDSLTRWLVFTEPSMVYRKFSNKVLNDAVILIPSTSKELLLITTYFLNGVKSCGVPRLARGNVSPRFLGSHTGPNSRCDLKPHCFIFLTDMI